MKTIQWEADERDVVSLKRIVRRGDVVTDVDDGVARSLVDDQRLASYAVSTADEQRASPTVGASLPIMITTAMMRRLKTLGYTQSDIDAMTPQAAHVALDGGDKK